MPIICLCYGQRGIMIILMKAEETHLAVLQMAAEAAEVLHQVH
jgi:hypothetical protein